MKFAVITSLLLFACQLPAPAQEAKKPAPEAVAKEWVLFDGKSLDAWEMWTSAAAVRWSWREM